MRYIPVGAYEAAIRAWDLLQLARYRARPGNVAEALRYIEVGWALLPRELFDAEAAKADKFFDEEAARAEVVSICLSCAAAMAPTARSDAIALVQGTLRIVGEDPELRAALEELSQR